MGIEVILNSSHGKDLLIAIDEIDQFELDNKRKEDQEAIYNRVRASIKQRFLGTEILETFEVKTTLEDLTKMYEDLRKSGKPIYDYYRLLSALDQELGTYASGINLQKKMLELSSDKADSRFKFTYKATKELARILPHLQKFLRIVQPEYHQAVELVKELQEQLGRVPSDQVDERRRLEAAISEAMTMVNFVESLPKRIEAFKKNLLAGQKILIDSQSETSILHPHFLENQAETLRIIKEADLINPIMPPSTRMPPLSSDT